MDGKLKVDRSEFIVDAQESLGPVGTKALGKHDEQAQQMNERCVEQELDEMLHELLHHHDLTCVSDGKLDLSAEVSGELRAKSTNDSVDASFMSDDEESSSEEEKEVVEEEVVVVVDMVRPDFNQRRRNFVMNALAMA